mmetsp:Transcript_16788/g.35239  ORF Transcript_16788/g.35239 Transcript_16788/m.35239 type:complete len:135 (-) Transcript_16788:270-674(-)
MTRSLFVLVAFLQATLHADSFAPTSSVISDKTAWAKGPFFSPLFNTENDENEDSTATKLSLEEKMKSWEASEEELKAATLGGVIPGGKGERSDAFDIGLYIAFPLMVIALVFFGAFPFIMDSIDTSSVGPPPTV